LKQGQKEVREHFKRKEPEKKKPIDPTVSKFLIGMSEPNKKKFIPPTNYECSNTKSYEKKKVADSMSGGVPQLGIQK